MLPPFFLRELLEETSPLGCKRLKWHVGREHLGVACVCLGASLCRAPARCQISSGDFSHLLRHSPAQRIEDLIGNGAVCEFSLKIRPCTCSTQSAKRRVCWLRSRGAFSTEDSVDHGLCGCLSSPWDGAFSVPGAFGHGCDLGDPGADTPVKQRSRGSPG